MRTHKPQPIIRVVAAGTALAFGAAACSGNNPPTSNPPPPDIEHPLMGNPPPPDEDPPTLPTWESVESGHPEGATNPPIPVLEVTADGAHCFKHWQSPMIRDGEMRTLGGRVLATPQEAKGTEVACPTEQRDALLARHAGQQTTDKPPTPDQGGGEL